MRRLALALAAIAAAVPVAPAGAATVEFTPERGPGSLLGVRFVAAPGETNSLSLFYPASGYTAKNPDGTNTVTIRDPGAVITIKGDRCTQIDAHTVTCGYNGNIGDARVELGDGDDSTRVEYEKLGASGLIAKGGAGNDTLLGSPSFDRLDGGGGTDTLRGLAGFDKLTDGDTDATADADVLDGGADGYDELTYASRSKPIDLRLDDDGFGVVAGEGDSVRGIEVITGGSGDDVLNGGHARESLRGGPGNDLLHGSDGDDTLDGGPGRDVLRGRAGDDYVLPRSGRDRISCGTGRGDEVANPQRGELLRRCERIRFIFDADGGGVAFKLRPKRVGHRTIRYDLGCPQLDEYDGEDFACRAPLTLRGARRGVLGRGVLKGVDEKRTDHTDVILTARGVRLADRKRGVVTNASLKFKGRKALRWTFVLRL